MKISELTRRDIFDAMQVEKVNWAGRLDEPEFLARIYDLDEMPSLDSRFPTVEGDIWQHRINNFDWDDDWVLSDPRFELKIGDDEILLRFLCETIHPVVRSDATEVEKLCQLYNEFLKNDGFQLIEKTRLSGKPIFAGREIGLFLLPAMEPAKEYFRSLDAGYVTQQITRMEASVVNDPGLAIGTAKEFVESCCKPILDSRNVSLPKDVNLPQLVKLTSKELELTPADIPDNAKAAATIKRLLSNLATVSQGLAELRNQYGTGHGKTAGTKGLSSRHAKLAVGAASTLAVFLLETHLVRSVDD